MHMENPYMVIDEWTILFTDTSPFEEGHTHHHSQLTKQESIDDELHFTVSLEARQRYSCCYY
jgi:hypothetical protein